MDWSNPEHIRRGSALSSKLKYLLARMFRVAVQIGKLCELLNFLGFMSQKQHVRSNAARKPAETYHQLKRNFAESLLQVELERQDPSQTER